MSATASDSSSAVGSHSSSLKLIRHLLNIGDAELVVPATPFGVTGEAPKRSGTVTIIYNTGINIAGAQLLGVDLGSSVVLKGSAWSPSGDMIGLMTGTIENPGNRMGMHICALRLAGGLIEALKDKGIHKGPFVIQSDDEDFKKVAECLALDGGGEGGDPEKLQLVLKDSVPADLEDFVGRSTIIAGGPDEMMGNLVTMMKIVGQTGVDVQPSEDGFVIGQTDSTPDIVEQVSSDNWRALGNARFKE